MRAPDLIVVVMTVVLAAFSATACKKKKDKKNRGGDAPKQEEQVDPNQDDQAQGDEVVREGDSIVYRSKDGRLEFRSTPQSVNVGESMAFKVDVCDGQMDWDLGNGQKKAGAEISYAYQEAGTYRIQGICTHPDGSRSIGAYDVIVESGANPNVPNQNSPHQSPTY